MISKEERYDNELRLHASRAEGGVREVHQWLCARRDEINAKWVSMVGDDLVKLQGEAAGITRLIKLIETGPTIKKVPTTTGGSNG